MTCALIRSWILLLGALASLCLPGCVESDRTGFAWRVVAISACHSGSFIETLDDGQTMVLTSAAADRRSYGCSHRAFLTFFGRGLFQDAVPEAASFEDLFRLARESVAIRERFERYTPSEPQLLVTQAISDKLAQWWSNAGRGGGATAAR